MSSFLNLGNPAERQRQVLQAALELRRNLWPHEGFLYRGAGDILLQHGKFYSGRELPEQYRHLIGEEKGCFPNAWHATQEDPTLRYCEGVYSVGAGHFTPHAWCLDPNGQLLELTLPTTEVERYGEAKTGLKFLPIDHWAYWGIVIHPDYMRAMWERDDGAGVLDRPSHDVTLNPELKEDMEEWRSDWPILREPYDPERREP